MKNVPEVIKIAVNAAIVKNIISKGIKIALPKLKTGLGKITSPKGLTKITDIGKKFVSSSGKGLTGLTPLGKTTMDVGLTTGIGASSLLGKAPKTPSML